jgi:DNA polymerase I-like protein with 3'-5' exonuclease and polymerase domains
MRLTKLVVGPDDRNRVHLFPFGAITGRNAPPASAFIFGPSTWLRGLIKPKPDRALAYLDYSSQEFFIMAALSRDPRMLEACQADDAYLTVAHVCGYVPRGATKHSHPAERAAFKTTTLALGYGMGPMTMARKLGIPLHQARAMLDTYKDRYHRFAKWSGDGQAAAHFAGRMETRLGWRLGITNETKVTTLRNFPVQSTAAHMLQAACCYLTETGINVCAPVHDAVLIEAPERSIDSVVEEAKR